MIQKEMLVNKIPNPLKRELFESMVGGGYSPILRRSGFRSKLLKKLADDFMDRYFDTAFVSSLPGCDNRPGKRAERWAAGLRTHMMVCLGSSLTMIVSAYAFHDILDGNKIILDPSRIASMVISGIGFIGAGTILFLKQGVVRGLTTASGLWTVAAIGLAAGGGMYAAAAITTALALVILLIIQPIEKMFSMRFKQKSISIIVLDR